MVADSHVLERNRIERLRSVIEDHPDHFGVGIDSATAIIFEHGQLRVIGNSYVTTMVPDKRQQDKQDRTVRFDVFGQKSEDVNLHDLFNVAP